MTGVATHAFLEPYIGVSVTKVTNKLHPAISSHTSTLYFIHPNAQFHPLPRFIPSAPTLYFSRQYVPPYPLLHPSPSAPALHSIRSHALFLVTICTTSPTPTPYFPSTCASPSTFPRILSHAPTYPRLHLQVDAPLLIPIQSLTSTKISSELRAPTSPSHALLPLLIRTFSFSYT